MRRVICVTLALLGLTALGSAAWAQCSQTCPERRTISVWGTAQVTADADLAIVRVGYKLYGPDAKTVYASALAASNSIMRALTASGIPKAS
ncbi:MAG: SIMPL domain-containing protein, partial [Bryobacteraceae bacterium]